MDVLVETSTNADPIAVLSSFERFGRLVGQALLEIASIGVGAEFSNSCADLRTGILAPSNKDHYSTIPATVHFQGGIRNRSQCHAKLLVMHIGRNRGRIVCYKWNVDR